MATVTIHQAKTQLSRLIVRACAGEEIVIARGKMPVARLQPVPAPKRGFGSMRGRFTIGDDFDEPLPEEELAAWER
ncbi:MAG: type II toxin-antitoxin system Phd/YefM family antitoxin [Alphaproteobacteria bacterium]|nr:type II toxin-antitoxin system Phd/YefM family antitoxin [Alphaproteobacteria bacterium]